MITIGLVKFRGKPTKQGVALGSELAKEQQKLGVKILGWYWTLGRYDAVIIADGPDKGAIQRAMQTSMKIADVAHIETLIGLKREEAVKLLK